jgi:hypothetical protein
MESDAMTVATASRANVLWFLPTHGDGRHLGSTIGVRPVSINYLRQVTVSSSQRGHDRNCALVTLQICFLSARGSPRAASAREDRRRRFGAVAISSPLSLPSRRRYCALMTWWRNSCRRQSAARQLHVKCRARPQPRQPSAVASIVGGGRPTTIIASTPNSNDCRRYQLNVDTGPKTTRA